MKLPRRQFLHLAAVAAALPAVPRIACAQAYPSRPARLIVPIAPAGASDITGAPDGSVAVGAARPAIHHREPTGRRHRDKLLSRAFSVTTPMLQCRYSGMPALRSPSLRRARSCR
jgi:hypothetical protein